MTEWKDAYWLAKVELKKSLVNLLLGWIIFSVATFIVLILYNNMNSPDPYHDIIFLILVSSGPFWLRNKAFKYQQGSDKLWFSPTIPMQLQLPISKNILVKSRLITYTAYLGPFLVVLFSLFYLLDSELSKMNLLSYIAFCFIWVAVTFAFGMITPAGDAGNYVTAISMIISSLFVIIVVVIPFYYFHLVIGGGIVLWTATLAEKWPLLATFVSIVFIVIGWKFWPYYMKKKMKKLDYM
ncbi:hypothetical protein [Pseudogracilibacillus sp. SO30301A]|uniref:hypothetical protein n=1 Tax=Pseudogracilibacillus sp. SO30301A TaxID=3098291 RepID=UPI00300E0722